MRNSQTYHNGDLTYVRGLPVGEFDWLEFKDSRWLDLTKCLDKLSEYASAYANYDGGYLVIGIKNPRHGHAIETDDGVPLNIKPDLKGWLEDIIPTLTDPPLQRLSVHLISDTETSTCQCLCQSLFKGSETLEGRKRAPLWLPRLPAESRRP
jgi:hypothetical protein